VLLQFNVTCVLLKFFIVWAFFLGCNYLGKGRDCSISFNTGLQLQRDYICLLLATFLLTCVFVCILAVCKIFGVVVGGFVVLLCRWIISDCG
jgi:hypothetical protein